MLGVKLENKIFTTMCKSSGQDSSPIKANLEYVG
jgi:hypothetical protein